MVSLSSPSIHSCTSVLLSRALHWPLSYMAISSNRCRVLLSMKKLNDGISPRFKIPSPMDAHDTPVISTVQNDDITRDERQQTQRQMTPYDCSEFVPNSSLPLASSGLTCVQKSPNSSRSRLARRRIDDLIPSSGLPANKIS